MSTTSHKKQPQRDGNPWAELAGELAQVRARLLELHQDAQTLARHAPMATATTLSRSLVGRRQAESATSIGTELQRWELTARNEAARLDLRSRR